MIAKKLLVADDSVTIQKVIRLALSNEGYEIQAVSDGNDAIQQISVFRPQVVLIDVSLPGKTAFEVKRAINVHADLRDVRFVLMSSVFEKVDEVQAEEVEFHARLTKPFDPAHLREILSQVLNQPTTEAPIERAPSSFELSSGFDTPSLFEKPVSNPAFAPSTPSIAAFASTLPPGTALEAASSPNSNSEDDIRQLTESTIRISGLDHFDKTESIPHPFSTPAPGPATAAPTPGLKPFEEPSSIPSGFTPSFTPSPSLTDSIRSPAAPPPLDELPKSDFEWSVQEPSIKPLPSFLKGEKDISFPLEQFEANAQSYRAAPDEPVFADYLPSINSKTPTPSLSASSAPPMPPMGPPALPPEATFLPYAQSEEDLQPLPDPLPQPLPVQPPAMSEKEIELLVLAKVDEALRKTIQADLPGMIEKIIKEEIHRLLSEQP